MKTRTIAQRLHDMLFTYMAKTGLVLSALPITVEKLDDIPEPQRALYVEKEGKYHLDVTGVDDTAGLKSALQKERELNKANAKALKEVQEQFAGIDPVKVREMMQRLDNDGEAALIAAGKIDEVVSKRTEKLQKELQKQVDAALASAKASDARAGKFSQRVLDNHIRQAATKAGLHQHAIDDALFRARSMFSLDEDGEAVQVGSDGGIVLGKDGKTPFSPAEWLEGMKESAPHWFPASSSGGGAGKGGKGGVGAKDLSHLSPTARINAAREAQAQGKRH